MTTLTSTDRHNLHAVLDDGTVVLVSTASSYNDAVARWDHLDQARRAGLLPGVRHLAVRHVDDPDPRWPKTFDSFAAQRTRVMRPTKTRSAATAARSWAREHGYRGLGGGWIDNPSGHTVCQGWDTFAQRLLRSGDIRLIDGTWWVGTMLAPEIPAEA